MRGMVAAVGIALAHSIAGGVSLHARQFAHVATMQQRFAAFESTTEAAPEYLTTAPDGLEKAAALKRPVFGERLTTLAGRFGVVLESGPACPP